MINPAAVKAFLGRKGLADSRRAKLLTEAELDERLALLPVKTWFWTKPKKHQKVCFLLGVKYDGYAFWLDMGGGKTKLSLDLSWYFKTTQGFRTLVLVPYGTQLPEWVEREAPKHRPDLTAVAVVGTPQARRDAFWAADADVVVCTYAGFLSLMCDRVRGSGMAPNPKLMAQAIERFQIVVCDEASYLKNHTTIVFRILQKMRKLGLARIYELTGTPFGKDPHDLWSQFNLLDLGETLGETLGLFRAAFFTTTQKFWGGFEYKFRRSMMDKLHRIVAHRSIRYESEEFEDLPPITGGIVSKGNLLVRRVDLPDATVAYYDLAVEELRKAKGNYQETENVWHRMRRLSSGYALAKDDSGDELPLVFPSNPKLDALLELLAEIPMGRQAIVFCIYQYTGKLLLEALRKAHYKVGRLYGGQRTKEQNETLQAFLDGKTHIMVASETAAYGLNLQCASYALFFESPTSPIMRRQMEKRLPRGDQKHHVFIYDLVVRGTVDERIIKSLEQGKDVFERIVSGSEPV